MRREVRCSTTKSGSEEQASSQKGRRPQREPVVVAFAAPAF